MKTDEKFCGVRYCPNPTRGNRKYCDVHFGNPDYDIFAKSRASMRAATNRYRRKRYAERKRLGLCIMFRCDKKTHGSIYCEEHRVYMNYMRDKERRRKKAAG